MSTQIICPDCGKEIVPADADVDPSARCRCGDVQTDAKPQAAKQCYICGKDLAYQKRFKDRVGHYWCADCATAQRRANRRNKQFRCQECNRLFPPHKLARFENLRLCEACRSVRERAVEK